MQTIASRQNTLFLYDLPPGKVTSVQIAKTIKDLTGIVITE